eukprot:COSAG03_NODE_3047_length_2268_cov_2.329645_2_plen_237_part_00
MLSIHRCVASVTAVDASALPLLNCRHVCCGASGARCRRQHTPGGRRRAELNSIIAAAKAGNYTLHDGTHTPTKLPGSGVLAGARSTHSAAQATEARGSRVEGTPSELNGVAIIPARRAGARAPHPGSSTDDGGGPRRQRSAPLSGPPEGALASRLSAGGIMLLCWAGLKLELGSWKRRPPARRLPSDCARRPIAFLSGSATACSEAQQLARCAGSLCEVHPSGAPGNFQCRPTDAV